MEIKEVCDETVPRFNLNLNDSDTTYQSVDYEILEAIDPPAIDPPVAPCYIRYLRIFWPNHYLTQRMVEI